MSSPVYPEDHLWRAGQGLREIDDACSPDRAARLHTGAGQTGWELRVLAGIW